MSSGPSRKRRKKKQSTVAYLSLVSLMDMFTIILVFLLHSFSSESDTFATSPNFKLPVSTSQEELRPKLTVQITTSDIIVEGKKVAEVNSIPAKGEMLIEPLYKELEDIARKSLFIAGINPSMELKREVVVLGDRSIPFSILQKVMFTCGQVGYNSIELAVISREG
jgi:biopolymer transport protein ExbD